MLSLSQALFSALFYVLTYTLTVIPQAETLVAPSENRGTRGQGSRAGRELSPESLL